ncbi:zinc-dependent metalloprotease [Vibrio sinaloensis]|uniref:zinc-dependent metalloprotease n=1 Tax=Photobacterium sp. (strain ATCC 43367) TaxID=379097 RepID=UPI00057F6C73|nr:zinc-dependent metalloprotease [Vibrio sinaloensis]KHT45814.1 MoxR-like ATPase [Vibrio sinaloensis]
MALKRLALASAVTAILAGCGADDQSYEYVDRDTKEIQVKDLKDGRWFYVPTTGAAPRFALNQFPFLQGMGRYVELCFTKTGLEVRAFDKNYPDSNLPKDSNNYCVDQDNLVGSDDSLNFAQVLEIPGDFAAYRCAEDAYDDCTNKEEINSDASLDYRKKTHFTPKPESLIVSEFNYEDLFGLTDGITEQGTPKLVSWEFDPASGVLNFELERTFRVDLDNISDYINFSTKAGLEEALVDGAFKSRFYYSLVHESVVASEGYQPIMYPVGDENDIGFFTTQTKRLNPITNKYDRDVVYLNRFNPDESIKYYLTDNFFEPKNKIFLDATIETVNKMNQALQLFGNDSGKPPIEIVNKSEGAGVHPGDLRYNIINLVDEPLANGLLGYGPSVANPMTGEIIKAHVNQYSGVARTGVPYYWDNLARFYNRNQLDLDGLEPLPGKNTVEAKEVTTRMEQLSTMAAVSKLENINNNTVAPDLTTEELLGDTSSLQAPTILTKEFNDDMDFEDVVKAEENRLSFWAENNVYPIEASWVSSTSKAMLDNIDLRDDRYFVIERDDKGVETSRTLRRWKQLPKELKQTVADEITVATYSNTLVHEIGHNVGLRHNFKGSNDKANYYTLEQAHALGLNNVPAYSSTMDYAPSMLDETPTWGLYDIAAFKFGYGRKVETIQDSPTSAPAVVAEPEKGAPAEEVAAYEQYLADLQVYENSFSQRFGNNSTNESLMVCSEVATLDGDQAGKSLYNCDFSRFDEAALSDNPEDYAKTRYGALYYLDNVNDIERKHYAFCTDGNVSLNSDCNRFDEGTTLDEIVTYEWQNYLDSYDRRNLAEYSTNGLFSADYPSYIIRRFMDMTSIRDKIEDLERVDNIYTELGYTNATDKPGDFLLRITADPTYCNGPGNPSNEGFCDFAYGAQKAAAYFLDVLATPELQCVIENSVGDQKVISFGQLLNNRSYLLPASYDLIDATCFDEVAVNFIDIAHKGYLPVAQTKNGRFLNSVNSFDPDYPWSNAVSVLGSWPDKALASYFLARRFSTRNTDEVSFASLLDLPGVQEEYENIMANIVAGVGLNTPLELIDKQGKPYTNLSGVSVNLHVTEQMESLSEMPRGIERFLDISPRSRQRIGDVILSMGVRQMRTSDYTVKSLGQAQFDAFTKQQDRYGVIAGDKVEFVIDGKTYVATKANKLAYEYANKLVSSDGYALKEFLDSYSTEELTTIATNVDTAWGDFRKQIVPSFHDAVLLYDAPIVNAMKETIDADIAAGVGSIGDSYYNFVTANQTSGDLVIDEDAETMSFKGGKPHTYAAASAAYSDAMILIFNGYSDSMMAAVDNVYAGYTAAETKDKDLWTKDLTLVNAYLTGDIAAVVGEYYELLDRLPNASDY